MINNYFKADLESKIKEFEETLKREYENGQKLNEKLENLNVIYFVVDKLLEFNLIFHFLSRELSTIRKLETRIWRLTTRIWKLKSRIWMLITRIWKQIARIWKLKTGTTRILSQKKL